MQEGRQGLEEEEKEEQEGRGMQVGLVEPQEFASLGVWEEVWETLQYRGGEEGGQAGSGVQGKYGGRQGHSHLSLPVQ